MDEVLLDKASKIAVDECN
jgi:hypothetical protein